MAADFKPRATRQLKESFESQASEIHSRSIVEKQIGV